MRRRATNPDSGYEPCELLLISITLWTRTTYTACGITPGRYRTTRKPIAANLEVGGCPPRLVARMNRTSGGDGAYHPELRTERVSDTRLRAEPSAGASA